MMTLISMEEKRIEESFALDWEAEQTIMFHVVMDFKLLVSYAQDSILVSVCNRQFGGKCHMHIYQSKVKNQYHALGVVCWLSIYEWLR